MKDNAWLDLLTVFVPLSFLTIGGGQSVISDIHRQAVLVQGWMSDAQFMQLYALSRVAPGPGSLLVTLVGWEAAGWTGALVASLAIFVPSSILVYSLARLWERHRNALWPRAVEAGLVPVAAGMILAAACTVLEVAEGGALAWAVAGLCACALLFTRISPFLLLGGGALAFLAWSSGS